MPEKILIEVTPDELRCICYDLAAGIYGPELGAIAGPRVPYTEAPELLARLNEMIPRVVPG